MRRVVPDVADLHLDDLYDGLVLRDGIGGGGQRRAWVALGSVTSLDGAASVGGTSGPLGGDADRLAFQRLRAACDAILVGAGTVRAENYRPPLGTAARRQDRLDRGLTAAPTLVVVSASLRLPPDHPIFGEPRCRPIVITSATAAQRDVDALGEAAEVVRVGTGDVVDLSELLRWLVARDLGRVVCEGGPRLAGALLADDLVDETFLTVAPSLVGGDAPRVVQHHLEAVRDLELVSVYEHDGELLLRHRRPDDGSRPRDLAPEDR